MKLSPRQLLLLAALTLMWGLNWPLMKFALREISPLWFRAVTMTFGALMLLAYYRARGIKMDLPRDEVARIAWLALPNIIGWHFFSIVGLAQLASGRAATLGFTMPVWTVLLAVLFAGERVGPRTVLAVGAGSAGVGLLVTQEFTTLMGRPLGVLWMQLAALTWAAGTLMMRRTRSPLPTEAVTVWMMLIGSVFFWIVAFAFEPLPQPARFSAGLWWALLWGVVVNYGAAQVIWFGMARTLPPMASTFSIMAVPLVGIVAATAVVGEVPQALDLVAALCIMVAIAAALLPRPGAAPRDNSRP